MLKVGEAQKGVKVKEKTLRVKRGILYFIPLHKIFTSSKAFPQRRITKRTFSLIKIREEKKMYAQSNEGPLRSIEFIITETRRGRKG